MKMLGLAAATALSTRIPEIAMAGPFERADFDKLVPADKKLSAAWTKSLFDRGTEHVYRGAELDYIGMPVGGIGAGHLYLGGDGRLWHWDIFNATGGTGADHYAHPMKPQSPVEQGFAIKVEAGGKTISRTLDRTGFPAVSFRGQYPIGTVSYVDDAVPLRVTMEAFSPFIPLSTDDSSLPATILTFTLTNSSSETIQGSIVGWLQNAALLHRTAADATRRNRISAEKGMTLLNCAVERDATAATQPVQADIDFEDWNKEDYSGWTVEGTAFGSRPAKRTEVPGYMGDLGGDGGRFVNSHVSAPGKDVGEKDAKTGKLTSKPFSINRRFINFWLGGGHHPGKTCINLRIDGKTVQTATGSSENRMALQSFNVSALQGKEAVLEIVDAESGPWGNIGIGRITFSDRPPSNVTLEAEAGFGTMTLSLLGEPAEIAAASGGAGGFDGKAGNDAAAPLHESLVGAIGRNFRIDSGKSVTVDFVLTWHFPNLQIQGLSSSGRYYASKFDSAKAVARHVVDHFEQLSAQTRLWRDTWYDSTLPWWFLDRTLLNVSILATGTCMRFADGRFYAWEGVGCCPGTCTHVWHYAHAMARLFPDLEREMRERVDLAIAFDPRSGVIGFRAEFDRGLAVDGQAGTIMRMYREHQISADNTFLTRNWPKIKKAIEPLLRLDGNDDGILEGGQMNTLDQPWYGKVAWLSSLYLGAIAASEQMAIEMNNAPFAQRCRSIVARGSSNLVDQLFDGEYFFNRVVPDKLASINSGTGCEIDQVFGQSWAWQVHLGRIIPEKQTRSALKSLWKYNFTPDVGPYRDKYKQGRWYAMPGEAGLLMCSFPRADWDYDNARGKGADWAAGYFNECMNGFEHQVAGHMIWEGLLLEGMAVERAIHDRYNARHRNPWNEVECGDHYSRSMASYGVYVAACGYEYHGPKGYLAFAPRLTPENFKAAFTAAEGWGAFSQQTTPQKCNAQISIHFGKLRLKELALSLPAEFNPKQVAVTLDGHALPASFRVQNGRVNIVLDAATIIELGQHIEFSVQ
ncbi:MAG TPA: GH116 family glycosyl-hydrolase [Tepidisphaeraceae bacterium]|nr:GH116 family glycosyl-hydrolase [Tepidisphaeraceae bacterium]